MSARHRTAAFGALAVTPRPLPAYRDMFLLSDDDLLAGAVLDCPSGSSPFGAQVRRLGGQVVSVDPAYGTAVDELLARVRADMDRVFAWQRANPDGFNWDYLGSPDAMERLWRAAFDDFAADFTVDSDRYREATLPALPFADDHFALAVSGFLLFVYPELLSFDDHLRCLIELARVTSGEVRVFPLHSMQGTPYPRLPELRKALAVKGIETELRTAACSYDPHPGSDRMLVCRQA